MKKFLKDSFLKNLIEKAAGYSFKKNILKIFNINDEFNEQLVKNRINVPYKEIKLRTEI